MESTSRIIKSNSEARQSKLKNKKSQLENLLRARARLDFEIKTLKKSISKDQKKVLKETQILNELAQCPSEGQIQESFQVTDDEDPYQVWSETSNIIKSSSILLDEILDLLLHYEEEFEI